jgi:small ligand-binding sensory domain FIST
MIHLGQWFDDAITQALLLNGATIFQCNGRAESFFGLAWNFTAVACNDAMDDMH